MSTLAAIERHPHALAVLGSALEPGGKPSHAYLFHGPPGAGKAAAARAFAAELLAEGAANPDGVRDRAERESHPDLTWVRASGASEMRRADIDEPVVAAAARRPFESSKRVFVIEGADTMNAEAANRMLKTLEEPASYVHLVLLTDRPEQVLPTISSRCLAVRFDAPTEAQLEEQLGARGIAPEVAQACAKLALGDANRAFAMSLGEGAQQRANAERFARCARHNKLSDQPWTALINLAQTLAAATEDRLNEEAQAEAESLPKKERNKYEKDAKADAHRIWRRVRTSALDEGLRLTGLWYRDLACIVDGAPELIYAVDRRTELEADAAGLSSHRLRDGIALVDETRASLSIYPDDQLQLEALAYRLARTLSYSVADSATWLSVSPASGTSTGEIDTIGVSFTTAGLAAGSYTASITVSAAGVASRMIAVSLTVLPGTPQLELSTTSLDAAASPGQSPTGQSFTVRNAGEGTLAYAVTADQSWITVSPASGTSTGETDTLSVSFSTTSLGAGTHDATLTVSAAGLPSRTIAVSVRLAGAGASFDLDGDGYSDALFRHMDGTISGWLLTGRTIRSSVSPPGMDASWTLAGAGDFDGDGRSFDFLWVQPASGSVIVALNDGATQKASGSAGAVTNGSQVAGVADFDGDGKSDVLWLAPATNTATVWLMDRLHVKSIQVVATLDAGWNVAATDDFDGDRKADILLQRAGSQDLMIWLLDGATVRQVLTTQLNTDWIAVGSGDFNGDGKADLVASAPILGLFSILAGNGTGFVSTELLAGGTPSASVVATGDYDADGKDDLLFYDASSGEVSIWLPDASSRLTRLSRLNVKRINTLGTLDSSWAAVGEKGTVR